MWPTSSPAQPSIRELPRSRAGARGPCGCWSRRTQPTGRDPCSCTPLPARGAGISRCRLATASRPRAPLGDGGASFESATCANVCTSGAGLVAAGQGCRGVRVRTRSSAPGGWRWCSGRSPKSTCARGVSRTIGCHCGSHYGGTRARSRHRSHVGEARHCVAPCVRIRRRSVGGSHGGQPTRSRTRSQSLRNLGKGMPP